MSNERYIGDGVCVRLERGRIMIISSLQVGEIPVPRDWIELKPEVFAALINFARDVGFLAWDRTADRAYTVSDEDYARDEEDKQRKRDAAEGFDED